MPATPALLLIGGVDSQLDIMAPARDLYVGPVFERRRAHADATGAPWFVLSSRWGLVGPDELIAPYRHSMSAQPKMFQRAWGRYVAEQLALALPLPRGGTVAVHAEPVFFDSVRSSLEYLELRVVDAGASD